MRYEPKKMAASAMRADSTLCPTLIIHPSTFYVTYTILSDPGPIIVKLVLHARIAQSMIHYHFINQPFHALH